MHVSYDHIMIYRRSDRHGHGHDDDHHATSSGITSMIEGHDSDRKASAASSSTTGGGSNGHGHGHTHAHGNHNGVASSSGNSGNGGNSLISSGDHLVQTYLTKNTPITWLSFTPRNLLLAAGVFTT